MKRALLGQVLIDSTGNEPLSDGVIVIDDGRIIGIGPQRSVDVPADAEVVDFGAASLLPGLIDSHVHLVMNMQQDCISSLEGKSDAGMALEAAHNACRSLRAGVTTVRDCGDKNCVTVALKRAIDRGLIEGPRLIVCGQPITTTAGHLHTMGYVADSLDEVLKAVRTMVTAGVDWIKVCATGGGLTAGSNVRLAQYSTDVLTALVVDAHRLGRKVAAHSHGTDGVRRCAQAGIDSIEHCSWLAPREGLEYDEATVELMKRKGLYVSHTIAGARTGSVDEMAQIRKSEYGQILAYQGRMLEYGVNVVISSDSGIPGTRFEDFAGSLEIAVKCAGFSPMGAIIAATRRPAEMLGLDAEIGTLEVGKRADILVVDGNPLDDIAALRRVVSVIKDGQTIPLMET